MHRRKQPTSRLQFMRTATQQILHLLRSHFSTLPGICPGGCGGSRVMFDGGGFGGFFGRTRVFTAKNTGEERHFGGGLA